MDTKIGPISTQLNSRQKEGLPSDTIVNLKNNAQVLVIITRSSKALCDHVAEVEKDTNIDQKYIKKRRVVGSNEEDTKS